MRAAARAQKRTKQEELETPEVVHPLIRTHEDTGDKAFYFNPIRTDRLVNMERAESDAMLDWVYDTITQDKYRYDHKWRVGDILIWDNRCLLHRGSGYDADKYRRYMRQTRVQGAGSTLQE